MLLALLGQSADLPAKRLAATLKTLDGEKAAKVKAAQGAVDKARSELIAVESANIRRGVFKPLATYPSKQAKANAVAAAGLRLDQARTALKKVEDSPVAIPFLDGLKVGEIGRVPGLEFPVDQILGTQAFLSRCDRATVMVRGTSTEGWADDFVFETSEPYEVTGTESYTTVAGAKKTVFVLRKFDTARLK